MGKEINLMINYPKSKRDINSRGQNKSIKDQEKARKYDKDFFDGDRKNGYGGFHYNPRFWEPVIPTFKDYYNLDSNYSILDIGCAKGFMLYDFSRLIPGIGLKGIDISKYAIENCMPEIKDFLQVGNATDLPFDDNAFDISISITTLHNLEGRDLERALKEISRVSNHGSFITIDAYRNEEEKQLMYAWNLTAKTILHTEDWKELFDKVNYKGDYYWFMP